MGENELRRREWELTEERKKMCKEREMVKRGEIVGKNPEMEFFYINLTKDSTLLLHAIHSPFYWQIKKTRLYFGLQKYIQKNQLNKRTRVYSWIAFCRKENSGQKIRQKTRV